VYSGSLRYVIVKVLKHRENSLVKILHDTENGNNNVHRTVTLRPQLTKLLHGEINIVVVTSTNDSLDENRVRLIADFEDIVA
jgi:hypothetical protein